MPSYKITLVCTCDEIGDDPCEVHFREYHLEKRVIELENEVAALEQQITDFKSEIEEMEFRHGYEKAEIERYFRSQLTVTRKESL